MHHNWIAIVVAIVAGLASGLFAMIFGDEKDTDA